MFISPSVQKDAKEGLRLFSTCGSSPVPTVVSDFVYHNGPVVPHSVLACDAYPPSAIGCAAIPLGWTWIWFGKPLRGSLVRIFGCGERGPNPMEQPNRSRNKIRPFHMRPTLGFALATFCTAWNGSDLTEAWSEPQSTVGPQATSQFDSFVE